jgi:5-amino-6-(5-phospho-D-ribitylamino)uracil phosphatase
MKYKLLALDVNGTIVSKNGDSVSSKIKTAINKAKEYVNIMLITGKSLDNLTPIIKELNLTDSYFAVEGGARLFGPNMTELYTKTLSIDYAKELYQFVISDIADYQICVNGQWSKDLDRSIEDKITTISIGLHHEDDARFLLRKLEEFDPEYNFEVSANRAKHRGAVILITAKDTSKCNAIEYIQKLLNISVKETIAVGEMPNDLAMFEASGFKVAIGNASDLIKYKADYVAPSVFEDGVVDVIEKFILGEIKGLKN